MRLNRFFSILVFLTHFAALAGEGNDLARREAVYLAWKLNQSLGVLSPQNKDLADSHSCEPANCTTSSSITSSKKKEAELEVSCLNDRSKPLTQLKMREPARLVYEVTNPLQIPPAVMGRIPSPAQDFKTLDRLYISIAIDNDNLLLGLVPMGKETGDDLGYTHGIILDVAGTSKNKITWGGSVYTGLYTKETGASRVNFTDGGTAVLPANSYGLNSVLGFVSDGMFYEKVTDLGLPSTNVANSVPGSMWFNSNEPTQPAGYNNGPGGNGGGMIDAAQGQVQNFHYVDENGKSYTGIELAELLNWSEKTPPPNMTYFKKGTDGKFHSTENFSFDKRQSVFFTEETLLRAFATNKSQGKWYYWRADLGFQSLNTSRVNSILASGIQKSWHQLLSKTVSPNTIQYEYVPQQQKNELNAFLNLSVGVQKKLFTSERCVINVSADVGCQLNTKLNRSYLYSNLNSTLELKGNKNSLIIGAGASTYFLPSESQGTLTAAAQFTYKRKRISYFTSFTKPITPNSFNSSSNFIDKDIIHRMGVYIPIIGAK